MHKKIWIETNTTIALLLISLLTLAISVQLTKASGSLVGCWKFDEGTGITAYDNSGNGNTGTLVNGPQWVDGDAGKALSFDGIDDYIQVPDSNSLDVTDALTIAMWFKPATTITPENPWFYSLLMKWHGIGDQWRTGYGVQIKEEGKIVLLRGHGSGECSGISGAEHTWNATEWYHIAITYDTFLPSGNGKIYVNGVLEAQDNETRPIAANTLSLCINNDPFELWHPQVKFFPGVIDDVRICNRALSEEEVKELAQVVDWWPMFSHDPGHTGYSTSKAPNTNNTRWTFEVNTQWITGPSVANGRMFSGAANGKVYALNESNGALLWTYATAGPTTIPAINGGAVFAPSNDNTLYALNESTGALMWSFALGGDVLPPVVVDGMVFTGTGRSWEVNGRLYALNKTNGNLIWNYSSSDGFCSPAVADSMVFSADCDGGRIYAFDEFTGSIRWTYTIGTYVDDAPSVANGVVYIAAWNGLLYALNATTGSLLWTSAAGPWGAAVAIANGRVICSLEGANEVRALNAITGSMIWSYFTGDRVSRLAIADGKVFVASKDRKIYSLNESTGSLIWSYDTGILINEAPCVPSVANGLLFVGSATESGVPAKLFAFGQHDVAVTDVKSSKTAVCQGYSTNMSATVANQGSYFESFDVTLCAESGQSNRAIQTRTITLEAGDSTNLTFSWDTTGWAKGNYTLTAIADTVQGETNTADNTFIDGWVIVAMLGDITGPGNLSDGKVDLRDVYTVAKAFGSVEPPAPSPPGHPWDAVCDINNDKKVDLKDYYIVCRHYGHTSENDPF